MLESQPNQPARPAQVMPPSESSGMQTLVRYASAVRNRIGFVFLSVSVFCGCGLLYYLLAPRVYESQAEVMIRSTLRDDRMVLSDPVLEDTVVRLTKDQSVDFSGIPKEERAESLRQRLDLRTPGGRPDIVQLRCRCDNPTEAAAILEAVVASYRSYMGFVDITELEGNPHAPGRFAAHMLNLLMSKKSEIEKRMAESRAELWDQMRKLDGEFEPGKSEVRPAGATRKNGEPEGNGRPLPVPRVLPQNKVNLVGQAQQNGNSPEEVLRLQMLVYENRLLGMLRTLIDDLADNAEDAKRKKAKAEVIMKPTVPTEPVSPRRLSHILFATFVFGGAFGLGLVFLLDAFDDRIRSHAEVAALLDVPVVGSISNPEASREKTSITAADLHEASMQCIPTMLAIDALRPNHPLLVLTRVNAHEHQSKIAERLAESYRLRGQRVLLIDAAGAGGANSPTGEEGLSRVLSSTQPVADVFRECVRKRGGQGNGIDVLSGGTEIGLTPSLLFSDRLAQLLDLVAEEFDRVIVDTPAFDQASTAAIIGRLADGCLLVVNPQADSRMQTKLTADSLQLHGCTVFGLAIDTHGVSSRGPVSGHDARTGMPRGAVADDSAAKPASRQNPLVILHTDESPQSSASDDDSPASSRQAA